MDIAEPEREAFHTGLAAIETEYERLTDLFGSRRDFLVASHVPPFNTSFDRHHAIGTREEDWEFLHLGSIALKLAIRDHDVFAAFSGHSHVHDYDVGTGRDGRPHCLNLGYRGIGIIKIDPPTRQFEVVSLLTEETEH